MTHALAINMEEVASIAGLPLNHVYYECDDYKIERCGLELYIFPAEDSNCIEWSIADQGVVQWIGVAFGDVSKMYRAMQEWRELNHAKTQYVARAVGTDWSFETKKASYRVTLERQNDGTNREIWKNCVCVDRSWSKDPSLSQETAENLFKTFIGRQKGES